MITERNRKMIIILQYPISKEKSASKNDISTTFYGLNFVVTKN